MNYLIIDRGDNNSLEVKEMIISLCNDYHFKYILEKDINENNKLDVVFSIGGDGTFLRAIHQYFKYNPIFITINTGNFGYLCEFKIEEINEIIPHLLSRVINYKTLSLLTLDYFTLLPNNIDVDAILTKRKEELSKLNDYIDLSIVYDNDNAYIKETYFALNEFRIHSGSEATIKFDVFIDYTYLETLRGDGCVISSSIGSSGISKSLGGALVDNEIEMLEFVENAPISNKGYHAIGSPFVLSKEKVFTLANFNKENYNIYYDSETLFKNDSLRNQKTYLNIYLSKEKNIRILTNPKGNYIKKTKEMFAN